MSHNEEEDYFEIREQNPNQGSNWKYLVRSERGGVAYGSLPKRKLPSDKFKVEINYVDQMLLSDMKVEVPSTLLKIRIELYGFDQGQKSYLKSGLASNEEASRSFQDLITFLRGKICMRLYNLTLTRYKRYQAWVLTALEIMDMLRNKELWKSPFFSCWLRLKIYA